MRFQGKGRAATQADHIQRALEATCGTLVALEALELGLSSITCPGEDPRSAVQLAIDSLRLAISELRTARAPAASPASLGFVLSRRGEAGPAARACGAQAKPRRTA